MPRAGSRPETSDAVSWRFRSKERLCRSCHGVAEHATEEDEGDEDDDEEELDIKENNGREAMDETIELDGDVDEFDI